MTELVRFYSQETKHRLVLISKLLGCTIRLSTRQKKDLILHELSHYLLHFPREWMEQLCETDLLMLGKSLRAGKDKWTAMDNFMFPSLLSSCRLVEVAYEQDSALPEFRIMSDLYDVINENIDSVMEYKEKNGDFILDRLVLGILNIYGAIPITKLVRKVIQFYEEGNYANTPTVKKILDSPLVFSSAHRIDGESMIFTPYILDWKAFCDLRKDYASAGAKNYARISLRQVLEASENSPNCSCGFNSPEGKSIRDSLVDLGYKDEDIHEILHQIWHFSQYPSKLATDGLFSLIDDIMRETDIFTIYEEFANKFAAYANSLPKWALRGHTANEMGCMKVQIVVEESEEEDTPAEEYKTQAMPQPDSLADFFKYGIAVKHIEKDKPCPCGSGLSYRRCHGKYLN